MVIIHVAAPEAAAPAYAHMRRVRGLPALKGRISFRDGASGPVVAVIAGRVYTLYGDDGAPCPAR